MALIDALQAPPTAERPRLDRERGRLAGSRCRACGTPSWPARAVCHRCGEGDLAATTFAPTGTLLTYTTVWVPRPGLPAPYVIGQVQLDDVGPRVFAHLRGLPDDATVPLAVELVLAPPDSVPMYWFERSADGS
ncbi:MAG TPA: OB-fold domain-containing protein [Conexibacter sp.]|nr:OB-fold domain-containing protein [Conexibacter sp.]